MGYAAEILSREQMDNEFRLWLIQCGTTRPMSRVYWSGVRAGGWRVWKYEHTPDTVAMARKKVRLLTPFEYGQLTAAAST